MATYRFMIYPDRTYIFIINGEEIEVEGSVLKEMVAYQIKHKTVAVSKDSNNNPSRK